MKSLIFFIQVILFCLSFSAFSFFLAPPYPKHAYENGHLYAFTQEKLPKKGQFFLLEQKNSKKKIKIFLPEEVSTYNFTAYNIELSFNTLKIYLSYDNNNVRTFALGTLSEIDKIFNQTKPLSLIDVTLDSLQIKKKFLLSPEKNTSHYNFNTMELIFYSNSKNVTIFVPEKEELSLFLNLKDVIHVSSVMSGGIPVFILETKEAYFSISFNELVESWNRKETFITTKKLLQKKAYFDFNFLDFPDSRIFVIEERRAIHDNTYACRRHYVDSTSPHSLFFSEFCSSSFFVPMKILQSEDEFFLHNLWTNNIEPVLFKERKRKEEKTFAFPEIILDGPIPVSLNNIQRASETWESTRYAPFDFMYLANTNSSITLVENTRTYVESETMRGNTVTATIDLNFFKFSPVDGSEQTKTFSKQEEIIKNPYIAVSLDSDFLCKDTAKKCHRLLKGNEKKECLKGLSVCQNNRFRLIPKGAVYYAPVTINFSQGLTLKNQHWNFYSITIPRKSFKKYYIISPMNCDEEIKTTIPGEISSYFLTDERTKFLEKISGPSFKKIPKGGFRVENAFQGTIMDEKITSSSLILKQSFLKERPIEVSLKASYKENTFMTFNYSYNPKKTKHKLSLKTKFSSILIKGSYGLYSKDSNALYHAYDADFYFLKNKQNPSLLTDMWIKQLTCSKIYDIPSRIEKYLNWIKSKKNFYCADLKLYKIYKEMLIQVEENRILAKEIMPSHAAFLTYGVRNLSVQSKKLDENSIIEEEKRKIISIKELKERIKKLEISLHLRKKKSSNLPKECNVWSEEEKKFTLP